MLHVLYGNKAFFIVIVIVIVIVICQSRKCSDEVIILDCVVAVQCCTYALTKSRMTGPL